MILAHKKDRRLRSCSLNCKRKWMKDWMHPVSEVLIVMMLVVMTMDPAMKWIENSN
jgi:hypothetical protein